MASTKKISELGPLESLSNDDEFIVVDKSTKTGDDASSTGSTSKIRFDKLKNQIGSQGEKGPQGEQGAASTVKGPEGAKGEVGAKSTEKGPAGLTITGPKGEVGAASTVKGPEGPKGEVGAASTVKGPEGPKGEPGPQGGSPTFENVTINDTANADLLKLQYNNSTRLIVNLDGTWNNFDARSGNGFKFTTSNGGNFTIDSNGNVGIGDYDPNVKLSVKGDNADIYLRDGSGVTSAVIGQSLDGHGKITVANDVGNPMVVLSSDGGDSFIKSGNVGIGTASPKANLDVRGNINLRESGGDYGIVFDTSADYVRAYSEAWSGNAKKFILGVYPVGHEKQLVLDTNGNVGIGTASPDHLLELNKNGGDVDLAFHDAAAIKYTMGIKDGSQSFQIAEGGVLSPSNPTAISATRFLIDTNGNVGIGTTDPGSNKLKVGGNVEASSMSIATKSVATQDWVSSQISNISGDSSSDSIFANGMLTIPNSSSVTEGGQLRITSSNGSGNWNIDTVKVSATDDKLRFFSYDSNGDHSASPAPLEIYSDEAGTKNRVQMNFGPGNAGTGYNFPFNYTGTKAGLVFQHHDAEDHNAGTTEPQVVFDFEQTGNANAKVDADGSRLEGVYPDSDLSTTIWWGMQVSGRKYNNGSGTSVAALGALYETTPLPDNHPQVIAGLADGKSKEEVNQGYNEYGLYMGELTNMGSEHGTLSGVENLMKDGPDKDTHYDTKMNCVLARVRRQHDGVRQVSAFAASSEGENGDWTSSTARPDSVLTVIDNGTSSLSNGTRFKNGIDLYNANLSENGALIMPIDGEIQARIGNSTKSLIRATNDVNNPVELFSNGNWSVPGTGSIFDNGTLTIPRQDDGAEGGQLRIASSNGTGNWNIDAIPADATNDKLRFFQYDSGNTYKGTPLTITNEGIEVTGELKVNGESLATASPYLDLQSGQINIESDILAAAASNTTILEQAIATALADPSRASIELPPGRIYLNKQIVVDFNAASNLNDPNSITIQGCGQGTTSLCWVNNAPTQGILVNLGPVGSTHHQYVTIRDFDFVQGHQGTNQSFGVRGTALEINGENRVQWTTGATNYEGKIVGDRTVTSSLVENCSFQGFSDGECGWNKCIVYDDCHEADIKHCNFRSYLGGVHGATNQGIWWQGEAAVHITGDGKPTDFMLHQLRFWGFETGILCDGNVEGVIVSQGSFVHTKCGINWKPESFASNGERIPTQWPLMVVTDCHMNCNAYNIKVEAGWQIMIKGCSFYGVDNEAIYGSPYSEDFISRSIYLDKYSSNCNIYGNTFSDVIGNDGSPQNNGGWGPSIEIDGHLNFVTSNTFTWDTTYDEPFIKFGPVASGNTFVHNKIIQPVSKTQAESGYSAAANFPAGWGQAWIIDDTSGNDLLPNVVENNY